MTDFVSESEVKQMMLIEALEYYIQGLKDDNCNQAAIDAFTDLLTEIENDYRTKDPSTTHNPYLPIYDWSPYILLGRRISKSTPRFPDLEKPSTEQKEPH